MELSIDTSTRYASVGLSRDGALAAELSWRSEQNHTVELAPAVQRLLAQAGARASDLNAVIIALGPGGFSALRVGLGYAKGLAEGLGVPLIGVGTLKVEASPYLATGLPVYPVLDAGRGQVAWAAYQSVAEGWKRLREECITTPQELAEALEGTAILCGEGLEAHRNALSPYLKPNAIVAYIPPPTRRAATLARLGALRLHRKEYGDPAALQPLYLRLPSVTLPGGKPT
ncbi:MAG: tRNA (adenosine(37)-N6)-threonylcarbamoyltransferase complex dimerization subunit type 1 TsaB [Dehalococcoidia bacterium]|nr:tRNA (adenosine(37)-N6)-threonylcarbamoyltransferase complex dimerization subunit type 1 TsaB [Dehalococcoidia bacterium]